MWKRKRLRSKCLVAAPMQQRASSRPRPKYYLYGNYLAVHQALTFFNPKTRIYRLHFKHLWLYRCGQNQSPEPIPSPQEAQTVYGLFAPPVFLDSFLHNSLSNSMELWRKLSIFFVCPCCCSGQKLKFKKKTDILAEFNGLPYTARAPPLLTF